jgi:hypothetical protein
MTWLHYVIGALLLIALLWIAYTIGKVVLRILAGLLFLGLAGFLIWWLVVR